MKGGSDYAGGCDGGVGGGGGKLTFKTYVHFS